jgi:hypothetical protein
MTYSRLANILSCAMLILLIGCTWEPVSPRSTIAEPSLMVTSTTTLRNFVTQEVTLTQTIQATEDHLDVNPSLSLLPGQYLVYSTVRPGSISESDLSYYALNPSSRTSFLIIDDVLTAAVSPDSQKLAFVRDNELYDYDREKSGNGVLSPIVRLPEGVTECDMPVWSPDSRKFLLGCGGVFEPKTTLFVEDGDAQELPLAKWCQGFSFSWSPDSEKFTASCSLPEEARTDIRIFANPNEPGQVIPGCELDKPEILCNSPSWSPQGNLLLFFKGSGLVGEAPPDAGYYLIDLDCEGSNSNCTRGATNPIVNGELATWSPSGTELALADGNSIITADMGTGKPRVIHTLNHVTNNLLWSPDGHSLVFSDDNILSMLSLETGELTTLAEGNLILPSGWISRLP